MYLSLVPEGKLNNFRSLWMKLAEGLPWLMVSLSPSPLSIICYR